MSNKNRYNFGKTHSTALAPTMALVRNRGHIIEQEQADFFAAGYEQRHWIEIILGLSQKVISN